jgi:hypothetical protein
MLLHVKLRKNNSAINHLLPTLMYTIVNLYLLARLTFLPPRRLWHTEDTYNKKGASYGMASV